jgi:hypothetical protein
MFHSVFSLCLYIQYGASPIYLETHFNSLTINWYTLYNIIYLATVEQ